MPKTASSTQFEDFLHSSINAQNPQELFQQLTEAVGNLGFDKVIFSITRDGDLPKDKNKLGIFHNYPSDWHKYYQEKRYDLIDPVLKCAAIYSRPFTWSELERKLNLSAKQHKFFRQGEDAGLCNGIGVPMRGSRGQLSGIALASSEKSDACNQNLDLIAAYCNQFYTVYKRFYLSNEQRESDSLITLSIRETEALKWLACGQTLDEISVSMNITKNTADTYVRNIYEKLGVNNKVQAVVKGMILGLISL